MIQLYENDLPTNLFFGEDEEFESIVGWVTRNTETFIEGKVSVDVDTQTQTIRIRGEEDEWSIITFEKAFAIKTNIEDSPLYNTGYKEGYKQATEDAIVAFNKSVES